METTKEIAIEALKAANARPWVSGGSACGCGRAYVALSSRNPRSTINAIAWACRKLGLTFLRKAYGTSGNVIYIGYDNADGRALAKAEAFAAELSARGIASYVDAVAD